MKQIKYGVGVLMGKKISEMSLEELWQLFPIFLTEHQDCCIDCDICEKSCPMKNITVTEGKASGDGRCTMCYRCFSLCPKRRLQLLAKRLLSSTV